jgi:peptidoglycan/LPS O-acetylase OafA/YrhL
VTAEAAETPQATVPRRPEILALQGLRFFAAGLVMVDHLSSQFFPAPASWWVKPGALGGMGMLLFFVLSGVVVHYNYAASVVGDFPRGTVKFFQARFARIYPLFILMLAVDLITHLTSPETAADPTTNIAANLPYALTLTQSWIYKPLIGRALYQAGFAVGGLTWSISTEWFFYLCYPLLAPLIDRLRRPRAAQAAVIAFAAAVFCLWIALVWAMPALNAFGAAHYGAFADRRVNHASGLINWLFYFSPYGRIGEFILGCLTAQAFIAVSTSPPSAGAARRAAWLMPLVVVAIVAIEFGVFSPRPAPWTQLLAFSYGVAPLIALLIYFCARHPKAWTARALAIPLLAALGDASYSIYLLHPMVFEFMRIPSLDSTVPLGLSISRALMAVGWVLLLAVSMYRFFEAPARSWLRRSFAAANPRRRWLAWSCVAAPVLAASALAAEQLAVTPFNTIGYVSATYGTRLKGPFNNAAGDLALQCLNKAACTYSLDESRVPDPAPGELKDLTVQWRCKGWHPVQSVTVSGAITSTARLTCP